MTLIFRNRTANIENEFKLKKLSLLLETQGGGKMGLTQGSKKWIDRWANN
jgi:hypothetical protein